MTATTEGAPALTMFTTPWCGYCARLKSQLARAGVRFAEVDIEADVDAAERVMSANGGNQTVPTLLFADGSTLTNPTIDEVMAKLAAG
ncbi:MAG: glutaredoxin-like protein [Pseudonocardiales bacterium]|nr:MAG: glutaredoxin-like protein [Pseudonocardiales bacterium]